LPDQPLFDRVELVRAKHALIPQADELRQIVRPPRLGWRYFDGARALGQSRLRRRSAEDPSRFLLSQLALKPQLLALEL